MHAEEKKLIDGLFSRLRDAQSQSAPREAQAEALIKEHLAQQPAAPYYMAQAIIVQENAIQQLDARIKELEAEVENLKRTPSAPQPSSGGFLAGLFGGSRSSEPMRGVSGSRGRSRGPRRATFDMIVKILYSRVRTNFLREESLPWTAAPRQPPK